MDVTYQVTPEMLGLSRRRVFRYAVITALGALLVGLAMWIIREKFTDSVISLPLTALLIALLLRPTSRVKIRLMDDGIEELGGPVIHIAEISVVKEFIGRDCPGLEINGGPKPQWLHRYSIFVPAALSGYEQIRAQVYGWAKDRWRTV